MSGVLRIVHVSRWLVFLAILAGVAGFAIPRAHADPPPSVVTVAYPNFSDLSALQLNGSAASIGNPVFFGGQDVLRLTNALSQGGSAFLTDAITLANDASFSTTFSFQITNPLGCVDTDGVQGADGLVFVVQTVANNVGGIGGGIGYQGIPNSVGVEFDTWNNGGGDSFNGNHVGINLNGSVSSTALTAVSPAMNNGAVWFAWVDYDGSTDTLEARVSTTSVRPAAPTVSLNVDLPAVLVQEDAFVGFTSGTGCAGGSHDIRTWTFINTFTPIATGTIVLNPPTAENPTGTPHTVTATVLENSAPAAGAVVDFNVSSGPNAGASGSATTAANGQASFTYTGSGGAGTDTIVASFTDSAGFDHEARATKTWIVVNEPPVAAIADPGTTPEGTTVTLDGSGSSDPDNDPLTYAWDLDNDGAYDDASGATAAFAALDGPASHTVGLEVCDPEDACDTATATVTVTNVAPTADAGANQTVLRNEVVSLGGTWTDPAGALDNPYVWGWDLDGDAVADASGNGSDGDTINATTSFATEGVYTLTFSLTDKDGGTDAASVTITVLNQAPSCEATPSIDEISPPNHRFVAVSIEGVSDADGDAVTIEITGIWQDEPVNGLGDGNTDVDGRGVGTDTAEVRAERSGSKKVPGNGRVYHIFFTADDGHGGSCDGEVTVGVPHDQRGAGPADDGALYDSTAA